MLKKVAYIFGMLVLSGIPALAAGGGRLVATQAIAGLSQELGGPLAYSLSIGAIVGAAVGWYRHHGEMGPLATGAMGLLFIAGIALGSTSLLGMIPGVSGLAI